MYLKFADKAQADSVLYTTTTEYLYEDRYGQPYPTEAALTEEDLEDRNATFKGIETTSTPNFANIDVLGTIYRPTGAVETVDGMEVPVMAALDGYHVNVRAVGEDTSALVPFAVVPTVTQRIWG